jgi:uncharacterized iron-regulated membrane protein
MWGRFGRKKTGRTENVWRRFGRLRTWRQGRAYSGTAVGLGIGVLALLIIVSLAVWLRRRRAGETTPATPAQEEGAEAAPSPPEEPPGPLSGEDPDSPGPTRL